MAALRWWVALWDRREGAEPQAMVRILLSLVILADWIQIGRLQLVRALFAPEPLGGMGRPLHREPALWLYSLLPPESAADIGYGAVIVLTVMVGLGLLTRLSAAALVLVMAQLAMALSAADRGIDMLIRNMLLLLVFSHSHRVWSLDALIWRRRAGGQQVPAWPRYLIVMQLVILYFTAGVQKVSSAWTPFGGFSALYIAMRDPAFAVFPPPLLETLYPLTQALTAGSLAWEWAAPSLLLALWFRDSRTRSGRLRSSFNRLRYRDGYLLIGACFHLGTAVSLQLGIFPWAVLALYPACFHPDEVRSLLRRRHGG